MAKSKPITLKQQVEILTQRTIDLDSAIDRRDVEINRLSRLIKEANGSLQSAKSDLRFIRKITYRLHEACNSRLHLITPSVINSNPEAESYDFTEELHREERKMLEYMLGILNGNPVNVIHNLERDDCSDAARFFEPRRGI